MGLSKDKRETSVAFANVSVGLVSVGLGDENWNGVVVVVGLGAGNWKRQKTCHDRHPNYCSWARKFIYYNEAILVALCFRVARETNTYDFELLHSIK